MNEPVWFRRDRDVDERFAKALDGDGGPERDAEFADELAVAAMLRTAGSEPTLDQGGRDRILAAIRAETPQSEGTGTAVSSRNVTQIDTHRRRKASLLAAATAAGVIAFGALGVELSRDALPGDLLYDVKRATESISLDLTFSQDGKATKHLEIASTRITELAGLVERDRADGGANASETDSYRSVLADLNQAVKAASRNVTEYATTSDGGDLRHLEEWSDIHQAKMVALKPGVPDAVANSFDTSITLLRQVESRAGALLDRMQCETITSGKHDELGALPDDATCASSGSHRADTVAPRASSQSKPDRGDQNADRTRKRENPSTPAPSGAGGPAEPVQPAPADPAEEAETPQLPLPDPSPPPVDEDLDKDEPTSPRFPTHLPGLG